jgi:hypothetical protein
VEEPINEVPHAAFKDDKNQCDEGKRKLRILLGLIYNKYHLLGLKTTSGSQSITKFKLFSLSESNFVPRKPRRLLNLSDHEEVEDMSPKVPKPPRKQRVKKLRKPKLWETESGPDEAPGLATESLTSLSELKDIQRKKLLQRTTKLIKKNTVEQGNESVQVIPEESEDFVEKDSGLGNSLICSSHSGEITAFEFDRSFLCNHCNLQIIQSKEPQMMILQN